MGTINFVPNDYIQQRQSSRANILYLMLLMAMIGAIGITFGFIKMRQRKVAAEMVALNTRMAKAKEQIAQLEELKVKGKTMLKTMVMTAELLEPVPRSVILASLTNTMPSGVSLLDLMLEEKEIKTAAPAAKPGAKPANQYQAKTAQTGKPGTPEEPVRKVETKLELMGIAPSDIEVASYIAHLSSSILLDRVELVESKERIIDEVKFREFKLRATLKPNLALTKEDIDSVRLKYEEATL
jgi:Tfp pilus assembly protein PilN